MFTTLDENDRNTFMLSMNMEDVKLSKEIQSKNPQQKEVPISEKALLTLQEASLLTGIGQGKLREISSDDDCSFVLWNGSKRMFKREKLIAFLYSVFSI